MEKCQDVWNKISTDQAAVKYIPVDVPEVLTQNISTESMVEALWKFVVEADPVEKDKIKAIRDKILNP